jgi:hypothetical protein
MQVKTGDIISLLQSLHTLTQKPNCPSIIYELLQLAQGFKLKEIKLKLEQVVVE